MLRLSDADICRRYNWIKTIITPIPYVNNILKDSLAFLEYVVSTETKLFTLTLVLTDI